jgi:acyl-coenzyme A thioesterase PaaI-like protein
MELPTIEQVNTVMKASIPLVESCRIEIVELEPGYARTTAPFEGNGNHLGTMYAGVLFTVAEVIGGVMAAVTFDMSKYLPVVRAMEIDFKRAARTDVFAEARLDREVIDGATAAADANGKAPYELRATVTDSGGEVVATTLAKYQIRRHGT